MSAGSRSLGLRGGVEVEERVRLRSAGDDDAREDRLFEEFVEVDGDLLRPLEDGNSSIV